MRTDPSDTMRHVNPFQDFVTASAARPRRERRRAGRVVGRLRDPRWWTAMAVVSLVVGVNVV